MSKKAFTLIELLIVVAIIAILAAIAVPNFLEAQTRAKVSRCVADMRTLNTAIEAYAVDNNKYPIDGGKTPDGQAFWYVAAGPTATSRVAGISTPIAYISSAQLIDPFRSVIQSTVSRSQDADGVNFTDADYRRYRYRNFPYTYSTLPLIAAAYGVAYGTWAINGSGPDRVYSSDPAVLVLGQSVGLNPVYDPTNGTLSIGDIIRSQKYAKQPGPHAGGDTP